MPNSSGDVIRWCCSECHFWIDDRGNPTKLSQDRGGKKVQKRVCNKCMSDVFKVAV